MIKITKFLRIGQTVILESTTYPGTTNEFIVSKLKKFSIGKNFLLATHQKERTRVQKILLLQDTQNSFGIY